MINRRNLIQYMLSIPVIGTCITKCNNLYGSYWPTNPVEAYYDQYRNRWLTVDDFETIELPIGELPEFPLSFVAPGYDHLRRYPILVDEDGNPYIHDDFEIVMVPMYPQTSKKHSNAIKNRMLKFYVKKMVKPVRGTKSSIEAVHVINDRGEEGFAILSGVPSETI